MATNKTIKIGVEFDLKKDTLEQLKRELNTIQDKSLFSNATTELKQAGAAAEKLIDILNQSYDTKLNQLDMTKFTRGLSEAGLTANSLKSTLEATGNSQAFNLLASSVMSANIQLKQTSTLMDKMAITMANTIRFGISSSVFNNLTGAVQKAYNYVLDLDESLNSIRVVSKQNTSQMEAFAKSANSAAKALGATTLDYTDAALIYYQQGLDTDKVQQMTDITIKMANVTKDSAEDVSSYMTAIWNNFADGSETLEHYADVITALGAATASSSSEIAEGLEKFASVAETVGLSYDYATAALATVVAQTRQSADTVGTAFKTLFARIQDLELGETLDDGTTLGTYSQALEKVGISIKDENGELKDMNDILDEMGEKWKTLSSDQQTALAQAVAGTRQYTQLVALMANYDTFKDNLEVAANATGELNEQNEIYLESTEAHLNTLKASAQSLYSSLFDTKEINPMIDAITQVIEGITKMSDAFGGGLKSLAGFSAMFVNVFQKQINQSLTRWINNTNLAKQNLSVLKTQRDFINVGSSESKDETTIQKAERENLEKQINTAERLKNVYNQLNEQDARRVIDLQNEVTELETQAALLEDQGKKGVQTAFNKYAETNFNSVFNEEDLEIWEKLDWEANTIAEDVSGALGDIGKLREDAIAGLDEEIKINKKEISSLLKEIKLNEQSITSKKKDGIELDEQEIKNLKEQNELNEKNKQLLKESNEELEERKKPYKEELKQIETLNKKSNEYIANTEKAEQNRSKAKTVNINIDQILGDAEKVSPVINAVNTLTTSVTALSSAWSGMSSLSSIWSDFLEGDVTVGEALIQTLTTLVSLYYPIKSVIDALKVSSEAYNASQAKNIVLDYAEATAKKALAEGATEEAAAEIAINAAKELGYGVTEKSITARLTEAGVIKADIATKTADIAVTEADTVATEAATAANEAFTASLLSNPITAMIVALTTLVGVIAVATTAMKNYKSEEEKEIESLQNAYDSLSEAAEKTKDSLTTLQSSFDQYEEYLTTLNSCIKGTEAWNEALQNVNQSVLEIVQNNPELLKINGLIKRTSGQLSIDKNIYNEYIEKLTAQSEMQESAALVAQKSLLEAQEKKLYNNNTKQITVWNGENYDKVTFSLSIDDQRSLANLTADEYSQQLERIAKNYYDDTQFDTYEEYLRNFKFAFKDMQGTFDSTDENISELETEVNNIETLLTPTAITASGETATRLWNEEVDEDSIAKSIREAEKAGVEWSSSTKDVDAITFMRNYVEASGGTWDASLFTKVSGNDKDRKYTYNGETFDADAMSKTIANAIAQGTYSLKKYSYFSDDEHNERWDKAIEGATPKSIDDITTEAESIVSSIQNTLGVSKDLADKIGATKIDKKGNLVLSDFTSEDILELQNLDEDKIKEVFNQLGLSSAEEFIKGIQDYDTEKAEKNLQDEIENIYSEGAEATGETVAGLKDIARMFSLTEEGAKLSEKELAKYAVEAAKFSNKMDTLADSINDSEDALEEWYNAGDDYTKMSSEARQAAQKLQTTIEDTFGVNVPLKTLQENFKTIQAAINGDKDALVEFQKILATDQLDDLDLEWNIELTDEEKTNLINKFNSDIEDIIDQTKDLEIGATFDDTEALSAINEFVQKSGLSAQEIQSYFDSIGYDAEVTMTPITQTETHSIAIPGASSINKVLGKKVLPENVKWTTSTDMVVPQITSLKKANNFNYTPKTSSKKSSSSSSGSSKSYNTSDETADRYQEVNEKLENISTTLSRLQKQEDKLVGTKLIENLNKQLTTLNDQIDLTRQKLLIAEAEQSEMANKLSSTYGLLFNSDGTINQASYESIFASEQKKYTSATTDDDAAKERWENFKEWISNYEELATSTIPGLYDDIQDAIDQQIEIKMQEFDMEIEIALDLSEAEKDWLEFKKKVIDSIKDDDILGTAKANLESFSIYYKQDQTGQIQENTKYLNKLMAEINKMAAGQASDWFGDGISASNNDMQSALEKLKTYYEQSMSDLEDVADLVEEIQDALDETMQDIADQMEDQLSYYDQISNTLEHNMKLVQLVYGEDAYSRLSLYYSQQEQNLNAQIDFQTQQVEFWKKQMDTLEEGTDAWETARDEWMSAVSDWQSSVETAIDNLQEKYLNTINEIFQALNNKVTSGAGLDYINQEWELINTKADKYLDTINATYGIQELQNKYLEAIDDTDNVTAQKKLNQLMEEEVAALKEKDKLTQYDLDRAELKYQIALKQIALEEAQQNKSTMRLRRDSQGNYTYQYVSDEDQISSLQQEISDLYNQLYNLDTDQYQSNLNEMYDIWTEFQEKMAEAAQINDPEERKQRELLLEQEYGELINGVVAENQQIQSNLHESVFLELEDLYGKGSEELDAFIDNEDEAIADMVYGWTSGLQQMVDEISREGGFEKTMEEALDNINQATEDYENSLTDLQEVANTTFGTLGEEIDQTISDTQDLIEDNKTLIDTYYDQVDAIQAVIDQLGLLQDYYNNVAEAAKTATTEAYKLWEEQNRSSLEAASTSTASEPVATTSSANTSSSTSTPSSTTSSSGGDGVLSVGETVTYTGGYYYSTSSGGGSKGKRGVGKQVKVTQIANGKPYPVHVYSTDSAYGWLKQSQLTGYDTGGYTGSWDNSGRLALLHQKELVLNAKDTENMLDAVNILRQITNSMNNNLSNKISSIASISGISADNTNTLEQDVHIEATFPNATSAKEIEDALNNLVNVAAQRAQQKR